ncbi:MAG: Pyrrolo-quinoline quinone, partial [Planctomycetaceae bacterium]|nr:Pyrrolo-quinoline quinone [Planctomycetaceae bacterium]
MRVVVPNRWVFFATWIGLFLAIDRLAAQTAVPATDPLSNSALPSPDLTQDRTSQQRFQAATQALEKGDFVRAGELVRWLVELPEDRWSGTGTYRRGIRRELFRQLAAWPANLRELYATDISSRAEPDLQSALQNRDLDALLRIAARYPDSEPGRQALRRAALQCFDRGDFSAAATISARSLPLPEAARADDLPVILHNAAARWRAGDRLRARAGLQLYSRLFDAKNAANADVRINAALASFSNARDDRQLEKTSELTFPGVMPRWSVSVLNDKTWNELFDVANQDLRNSGMPSLPAAIPCVTDSLVLLRTYASLAAFDLQSGKPVWECSALSDSAEPRQRTQTLENAGFRDFKGQELLRYLVQNQVTGSCVADRQQAYFIGEKQRVITDDQQYPRPRNQLVACRLLDGTITWQSWLQPELSDIYFLSQPIIHGGRLYLLGETESQLKLVVLKCADGRLEWQLPLASIKQDLLLHPGRKLRQLPVLWQDGWLICPTGSGCILSIDTVTRNYEWAYRYVNREVVPKAPGRFGAFAEPSKVVPLGGWQRIGLARDARRVYFVTPESDSIQALDAQTGQLVWEQPRVDGLYLGGLVSEKLLVVGDRSLKGLDPETGNIVWQREIDRPSGIGMIRGNEYLLPLGSGSVLLVDAATGKTLRGAQGSQAPLGNLVASSGVLVSLTPQRLEVYGAWETEHQELLTRLMRKPDDPDLLGQLYSQMRRGGDVAQVATLLRELYRQQPQPTLRVQLVRTLLELVATRPELKGAIFLEITPLVSALGDLPDELRCRIHASVIMGDRPAALRAAIKLAAQASMEEFEPGIDKQTVVRSDRALQGVLLQLLQQTPDDARPALEKILDETLQAARGSSDPFAIQRFALQFSHLRWGQQARISDHTKVGIGWPAFRQELSLLDLTDGADQTISAAAFLKLAQEMTQRSFRQDAIRYYATLRDEFADVRLDPSHTVSQVIAELPAMSLLATQLKAGPVDLWPATKPAVSKPKGKPREPFLMPIPIESPPGSLLDRINVTVDLNASRLLCQGDWYPGYWEIPLPKSRSPLRELIQTYHGWGLGQLLVVGLGSQLYGVSLLDNTGEPNGRVVWTFDLADDLTGRFEVGQVQNRQGLGEAEVVIFDDYGREVGQ